MMAWSIKTKREEKQRVMRPRILREMKQEAAHLCLPNIFNATDWMDRFLRGHNLLLFVCARIVLDPCTPSRCSVPAIDLPSRHVVLHHPRAEVHPAHT